MSIVLVLLPLLLPSVREYIIKEFELSRNKALEDRKSENERKNHVTKVRFDKEFEIYEDLSEKMMNVSWSSANVVLIVDHKYKDGVDLDERESEFKNDLQAVSEQIKRCAIFVPEDIYSLYERFYNCAYDLFLDYVIWKDMNQAGVESTLVCCQKYQNVTLTKDAMQKNVKSYRETLLEISKDITTHVKEHLERLEVRD